MLRQLRLALRTGIVTEAAPRDSSVERVGARLAGEIQRRFGLRIVASPRHADCLLVTGPVTRNMAEALRRTWEATPDPKIVIVVGDCGRDGGIFRGSYAIVGGADAVVPVDAIVPGCPPSPAAILGAILDVIGRLR